MACLGNEKIQEKINIFSTSLQGSYCSKLNARSVKGEGDLIIKNLWASWYLWAHKPWRGHMSSLARTTCSQHGRKGYLLQHAACAFSVPPHWQQQSNVWKDHLYPIGVISCEVLHLPWTSGQVAPCWLVLFCLNGGLTPLSPACLLRSLFDVLLRLLFWWWFQDGSCDIETSSMLFLWLVSWKRCPKSHVLHYYYQLFLELLLLFSSGA